GYDYENRPVVVILSGKWDTLQMIEEDGQD
ncbi:unnamed protein product, partial [Allacma fusca]